MHFLCSYWGFGCISIFHVCVRALFEIPQSTWVCLTVTSVGNRRDCVSMGFWVSVASVIQFALLLLVVHCVRVSCIMHCLNKTRSSFLTSLPWLDTLVIFFFIFFVPYIQFPLCIAVVCFVFILSDMVVFPYANSRTLFFASFRVWLTVFHYDNEQAALLSR